MKRRHFLAVGAMALLGANLATQAQADTLANIQQRKQVLVALDLGSPPFGMTDASMQPVGSDVETAKLFAQDLGYDLKIVQVTSPNRIPFLLTNKADIVMASLSVTDERKKVIDFSNPYGVIQSVIAARPDQQVKDYSDLVGKRIGTTRGSVNDTQVTNLAKGAEIVRYDDDATLVTALVSGQVDFMATSPQIMKAANDRDPKLGFEVKLVMKVFPYAIGIRKGDDALRARLNEIIAANLANGKLNAIFAKYNGTNLPANLNGN
ncbi:MAG: transporter substrate-binding domain-containing protein [Rhizobiaceae bacterium]|nr:transporter substrate-binding domain-containing protein [Rhizobiaceae bacterium]